MNKHLKRLLIIAVILALAISASVIMITINERTLSKNIDIPVYIPEGMADSYKDLMKLSFDDYRIWEYKLNGKEVSAIQEELDNGIWQKPSKGEYDDIIDEYFRFGLEDNMPSAMTENIFYCLYDDSQSKFISINSDAALLGWHRNLFIYDFTQQTYWCVARGI